MPLRISVVGAAIVGVALVLGWMQLASAADQIQSGADLLGTPPKQSGPPPNTGTPEQTAKLAAAAGLLFLHVPLLLIFLYAFTSEEKSYVFPPPGLTLKWFAVTWNRPDVWEAMILSVKVVDDLNAAIAHIETYGSQHTETIVTNDFAAAERFLAEVDSAAVLVNASTRFNDGGELGLGAEIGISTDKFHARGPCGLRELTSYKWVIRGNGQVRG